MSALEVRLISMAERTEYQSTVAPKVRALFYREQAELLREGEDEIRRLRNVERNNKTAHGFQVIQDPGRLNISVADFAYEMDARDWADIMQNRYKHLKFEVEPKN